MGNILRDYPLSPKPPLLLLSRVFPPFVVQLRMKWTWNWTLFFKIQIARKIIELFDN